MLKLLVALVVIALLAALLAGCVERLFFFPDRVQYSTPAQFGLQHEEVHFNASDGVRLHGWWLPAQGEAVGTVLHLHGNAANISNHLPIVAWLPAQGFNVLLFDYRGFGQSEGSPSLDGSLRDAQAALDDLRSRAGVDANKLILLGQSLGGATALRLLAQDAEGVRLAIIEAAFASYRGIAREAARSSIVLAPLAPLAVRSLPGAAADPITALQKIRTPLLFLHGGADAVIPFEQSQRLYEAATGEKALLRIAGAGHLEPLDRDDARAQVLERMRAALR